MPQFSRPDTFRPLAGPQLPRMDPGARGFVVSHEAMIRAQQAPVIDARGFVAEAAGRAAIGQGLQGLGEGFAKIAAIQAKAVNDYKVAEASKMMDIKAGEIAERVTEEQDETKWGEIAAKELASAQKIWNDDKALSPFAREEIQRRSIVWEGETMRGIRTASAHRSVRKAEGEFQSRLELARESGDLDGAREVMGEMVAGGYATENQAKLENLRSEQAVEQALKEEAFKTAFPVAHGDPDGWLRGDYGRPDDPMTAARLDDVARTSKRQNIADSSDRLKNLIASGELSVPEQVDQLDDPVLKANPALREEVKDAVRRKKDATHRLWVEANGVEQSVLWRKKVQAYDPESDPDGAELFALRAGIEADVAQRDQGLIEGILMGRLKGEAVRPKDEIDAMAKKALDPLFDEEKFGRWKGSVDDETFGIMQDPRWMREVGISKDDITAIQAEGNRAKKIAIFRDAWGRSSKSTEEKRRAMADKFDIPMWNKVNRLVKGSDDTPEYRAALAAQTAVEQLWNTWRNSDEGRNATPQEAMAKLIEFQPEGARAGMAQTLDDIASGKSNTLSGPASFAPVPNGAPFGPDDVGATISVFGKVTSYGYKNDEMPDSNSSAGIGAWVSKDEQRRIKAGEDTPNKLKENDLAVSPDVEKRMRAAGIKPHDRLRLKFADGSVLETRWMDRTAANLKGRWDLYRAGKRGLHTKEAAEVVGFERLSDFD